MVGSIGVGVGARIAKDYPKPSESFIYIATIRIRVRRLARFLTYLDFSNILLNAEGIKQAAIDDLRGFIGEQQVFDDITLVVFKRADAERVENQARSPEVDRAGAS